MTSFWAAGTLWLNVILSAYVVFLARLHKEWRWRRNRTAPKCSCCFGFSWRGTQPGETVFFFFFLFCHFKFRVKVRFLNAISAGGGGFWGAEVFGRTISNEKRSGREQDCKVAKTVRSLLLLVCSDKIQKWIQHFLLKKSQEKRILFRWRIFAKNWSDCCMW